MDDARYFHSTLYKFDKTAVEEVTKTFRAQLEAEAFVKCTYEDDHNHHHFDITCVLLRFSIETSLYLLVSKSSSKTLPGTCLPQGQNQRLTTIHLIVSYQMFVVVYRIAGRHA